MLDRFWRLSDRDFHILQVQANFQEDAREHAGFVNIRTSLSEPVNALLRLQSSFEASFTNVFSIKISLVVARSHGAS